MSGPSHPRGPFRLTHDLETGRTYPEPTIAKPSEEELWDMLFDGLCPATDGCEVEPDGTCPHCHPAWPRRMGLV
jgi:hypothetical protein